VKLRHLTQERPRPAECFASIKEYGEILPIQILNVPPPHSSFNAFPLLKDVVRKDVDPSSVL